jgi:hypothetical protein
MDTPEELRAEIDHLRDLSALTTDPHALAEIGVLIRELLRRLRLFDNYGPETRRPEPVTV